VLTKTGEADAIERAAETADLRAIHIDSKVLLAADLEPLRDHLTLERAFFKLKSKRETEKAKEMLDLELVGYKVLDSPD
jgi:hypothetical protein